MMHLPRQHTCSRGGLLLLPLLLLSLALPGCGRARPEQRDDHPYIPPPAPAALLDSPPTLEELRGRVQGANLIICVIDAARADHLGAYGYPRPTTPNLDRLAQESVLFERHFCPYPATKPSTASLFTSQHFDTHFARGSRRLAPGTFTMAKGLGAAGFHTALITSNAWTTPAAGIGEHFQFVSHRTVDHIRRQKRTDEWRGDAVDFTALCSPELLLELISDWLDERPESPFFAYIHFMPPHKPYDAPGEMKRLFQGKQAPNAWRGEFPFDNIEPEQRKEKTVPLDYWVNLYDANLRWADWAVGEVEHMLRDADLLDSTLFIVTSDHGEAFGEHGYLFHNHGVYDELVHVPLLIRFPDPGRPVGRISALTHTTDILPTIFDLLEVPCPRDQAQGRSLLPLITQEAEAIHHHVFARCEGRPPTYLIRDLHSALILYQGGKLRALYDLDTDPRQTRNIIEDRPELAAELIDAFLEFADTQRLPPLHFLDPQARPGHLPPAPEVTMSEQTRRELEALGYLK